LASHRSVTGVRAWRSVSASTPSGGKLRVLAVTNMYPAEDNPVYGVFVATQMRSIADAGVEVQVEFIDGRRSAWAYGVAISRLRRLADTGHFDVLHAHYGLSGFVSSFQPLPLVVSFCGDDLLGTPNGRGGLTVKSQIARRLSFVAARRADAIICKSQEMRWLLPRPVDVARALVIPNGVDTTKFVPGSQHEAREQLGIPVGERLVLFPHTSTERRKRLDLAKEAIARLQQGGTAARLMLVEGVAHERMPSYYRASDCLLLTSDWEGSPNVVKEALACDLPVVAVDVGDVREWLDQVPGNRLVARDADLIAAALREIILTRTRVDGTPIRAALGLPRIAERVIDAYVAARARRSGA
jgi:glycosyltransferase involved in cell wall biosynthesis